MSHFPIPPRWARALAGSKDHMRGIHCCLGRGLHLQRGFHYFGISGDSLNTFEEKAVKEPQAHSVTVLN